MARRPRHYEVWDSTPTGADIVGHADSLLAALSLYLHTRKTAPGHTINLLVDKPTNPRPVRMIHLAPWFLATGAIALIWYRHSIDSNSLSLPVPVIAIITVTCVVLAGLVATVGEQRRNRHRQALQATATPDESFTGHCRDLARTRAG
jgi:hypothetical protein